VKIVNEMVMNNCYETVQNVKTELNLNTDIVELLLTKYQDTDNTSATNLSNDGTNVPRSFSDTTAKT
jgi:hypothetical protein